MALVKYADGGALAHPFTDVFEPFFNDSFFSDRMVSRVPAVNVSESNNHYHIEMAAPGLKKDDFKINLDRKTLTISAERQNEHQTDGRKYNKREYSYTSFVRSFTLPDTADDATITASYLDGVLTIDVAKKEDAKYATRQITIK